MLLGKRVFFCLGALMRRLRRIAGSPRSGVASDSDNQESASSSSSFFGAIPAWPPNPRANGAQYLVEFLVGFVPLSTPCR